MSSIHGKDTKGQKGVQICDKTQMLRKIQIMKRIEVVAAIIIRNGKVFATQRGYGEWKGWWEFPGGKMWAAEWLTRETLHSVKWLPADEGLIDRIEL